MPLAIPMIAGPGAVTSAIVLMNEATAMRLVAIAVVPVTAVTAIGLTYIMMRHSDVIVQRIGQRKYRAVNRLMGMLLSHIRPVIIMDSGRPSLSSPEVLHEP